MIGKTTLPQMWWPLMGRPSVKLPYCPICGRTSPLEQHHPVRRGAGKLFDANGPVSYTHLTLPTICSV